MLFPRLCVWTFSFAFRNGYYARLQSLHMPVRWSKPNTTSKLAHVPVCWKEANRKFQMFFDFPFQVLPYIPNIQESPIECPLSASDRTNELSSYSVGSATPHNTLVRSSARRRASICLVSTTAMISSGYYWIVSSRPVPSLFNYQLKSRRKTITIGLCN